MKSLVSQESFVLIHLMTNSGFGVGGVAQLALAD
jgi:hypothetical protein